MRWLIVVLVILLLGLQARLWVGEGSLAHKSELDRKLREQQLENERLQKRNEILARDVESLKTNLDAIEEKARQNLGLIKQDEVFYLVTDDDPITARLPVEGDETP
ncbi:septum formation initiator family protein [Porticoccaceae bacterium]|nr:septum formation initiator family protein [Porticoccaceae bacterium]MDA8663931.1 septum formation initiator family protein [Porticoccaceae bacterium]MDA8681989.1 septum formation initiator family protein [Porticoccaceae bacterium]MDB2344054.1 septum formation initiator family protein [Porticoccaceae bacterium]MDB2486904.1 septum formation initiator family protein [Porticoccaceae bacterium]